MLVCSGLKEQETVFQDLQTWTSEGDTSPATGGGRGAGCLFFPAWEILPHEARLPHADVISERLETLAALVRRPRASGAGGSGHAMVTSVTAIQQRTLPEPWLRERLKPVRRGDTIDPLDLVEWLEEQAYEPEAQVTGKGELSLRGGILDIYPLTSPWPVRIEFFGNEVESIRQFDPQNQVSLREVDEVLLTPGGELGLLKKMLGMSSSKLPKADPEPPKPSSPAAPPAMATLLDYLPTGSILLLCDRNRIQLQALSYGQTVPPGDPFHLLWPELLSHASERGMITLIAEEDAAAPALAGLQEGSVPTTMPIPASDAEPVLDAAASTVGDEGGDIGLASLDPFRPIVDRAASPEVVELQRKEFFGQLHRWIRQNFQVHVFCNNEGERQRFGEVWGDYGLPVERGGTSASAAGTEKGTVRAAMQGAGLSRADALAVREWTLLPGLSCTIGSVSRGFLCEAARLVVVTDAEIFGRYRLMRPRRLKSPHAIAARSALDINFAELEEGDLVVHLQHGIGRFRGLSKLAHAAATSPAKGGNKSQAIAPPSDQECLVIEYAPSQDGQDPPKLYVPLTEAHLVSKYVGAGKARPPLNVLGAPRWAKTKAQAAEAVRDLAAEMLRIQAVRASQQGLAYPADTSWQMEFESAFVYEETPDQIRAIADTKRDMESPKPMDRLICGDVGFGKTEVAIRAAFKAVLSGKQVAVLVPTTVLAQQHYNTFRERMADYPVRIDLLSRFRGRRDQQRVVEQLGAGAVDIVIGTHRVIQKDIVFKDLGLVVVDEEQRFGVHHKERLKRLREMVDVLTLSATPIPRTLYMALTGARDMSTIETPPQDRLPVETVVSPYDERIVRDAIRREIGRGGQVFFLHNRILDIESVGLRLKALVPEARIEIGHGQMDADDLERVMTRFVDGEFDVLLSTTIIESGIDIPNANTIIIDRADRFGLSDLYQLRGRVGRYKHQAYAYLLIPRHAGLLADARKRIGAIKQFSAPGSGFKIAMRDLEIRGAGNLLGPEQSGHITAVGFELYCQLLDQSIRALKGEPIKPVVEVSVRLDFLELRATDEVLVGPATAASAAVSSAPGPKRDTRPVACFPSTYIAEPAQRIELYRKLAQLKDKRLVEAFRGELRDRFGPLPPAAELLLAVTELKCLAAERGVTAVEVKDEKIMLSRRGEYVTPGGKFPRLMKKEPKARVNEIRRLLALT